MRRTERTPIDDDAENARIRPPEACVSCQFRVLNMIGRSIFSHIASVSRQLNFEHAAPAAAGWETPLI